MISLLIITTWLARSETAEGTMELVDSDLRDLSLLPLDKLLEFKRALSYKDVDLSTVGSVNVSSSGQDAQPQALRGDPAVRGTQPPRRGGGPPIWVEEVVDVSWKGGSNQGHGGKGKGGLQGIFQGTVTVLAFLAFGGYLICLIIHAVKAKEAALTMTLLTTVAPAVARQRRAAESRTSSSAEEMYMTMRSLAEAYAKYNQRCVHN